MYNKNLLVILFLIVAFFNIQISKAQTVPASDSLALVDFYNSTGGPDWNNNNNWLTTAPVNTWNGVFIKNGRVNQLNAYYNHLVGTLPATIGNLTALEYFNITNGYDSLTGPIPASIGRCQKLSQLYLRTSYLTGSIPDSIGNLKKLVLLDLSGNELTGNIPATISQIKNLKSLDVSYNKLSGSIPSFLGKLKNVYLLELDGNNFSGTIPGEIGFMAGLQIFDVAQNNLTGSFPKTFINLKQLNAIGANDNHLSQEKNAYFSLDSLPSLYSILVFRNNFNFNGIETVAAQNVEEFNYKAQAPIKLHFTGSVLSTSAGGTLSKNTYSWYKTGTAAPLAVLSGDSTFTPLVSGKYYALITNAVATKLTLATDTVAISVSPLTKAQFIITPNPVKTQFTIQGLATANSNKITVSDGAGNIRFTNTSTGQKFVVCNVSHLAPGIYTVTISNGKSSYSTHFIKE